MFTTEIKIKGKKATIRFGGYVQQLLYDDGIKLEDLEDTINENPFGILNKVIYYGIINGSKDWKGDGITLRDVFDYTDSIGLLSKEATDIISLYTDSITKGVPDEESKPAKASTKKKK